MYEGVRRFITWGEGYRGCKGVRRSEGVHGDVRGVRGCRVCATGVPRVCHGCATGVQGG